LEVELLSSSSKHQLFIQLNYFIYSYSTTPADLSSIEPYLLKSDKMVRTKKTPLDLRGLRPALELQGPARGLYAGLSSGFINREALRKHNVEHLNNDSAATQKHRKKLPSGKVKKDSAEVEKMSEHVNEAIDRENIFTRKRQKDAPKVLKENEDMTAALYREESSASKDNRNAAVNNKTAEYVNIDFDRKMTLRSKVKDGSPLVGDEGVSRSEKKKARFTVTGAMISNNLKIDYGEFVSGEGSTTTKEKKDGSVHPRLIITFKLKMKDDSALPPERSATVTEKEDGFFVPAETSTRKRKRVEDLAGAGEDVTAANEKKSGAYSAAKNNVNNTQLNSGITGTRKSTRK